MGTEHLLILVFITHFIADFPLQTVAMKLNKGSSVSWLAAHGIEYLCVTWIILVWFVGWQYILVNAVAHTVTDYFTSKWTKRLHAAGRTNDFFTVIGLDQLIHHVTLVATLGLAV